MFATGKPLECAIRVVSVSRHGDQMYTISGSLQTVTDEPTTASNPTATTLRVIDNCGSSVALVPWHAASVPDWVTLPRAILHQTGPVRPDLSVVVFQSPRTVIASEDGLFAGTLPKPLDARIYAAPVTLALRQEIGGISGWLDLDADSCDLLVGSWLKGPADADPAVRSNVRHDPDVDSSMVTTDDDANEDDDGHDDDEDDDIDRGVDSTLATTTTTTDDEDHQGRDDIASSPRRAAKSQQQQRRQRGQGHPPKSHAKGRRAPASLSRLDQECTLGDLDDGVGSPARRGRSNTRRRTASSLAGTDDDNENDHVDGQDGTAIARLGRCVVKSNAIGKATAVFKGLTRTRGRGAARRDDDTNGDDDDDDDESVRRASDDDDGDILDDEDDDARGCDDDMIVDDDDDGDADDDDAEDADDDDLDQTGAGDMDDDLADDEGVDDDPNAE
jgi:hypothetical protein